MKIPDPAAVPFIRQLLPMVLSLLLLGGCNSSSVQAPSENIPDMALDNVDTVQLDDITGDNSDNDPNDVTEDTTDGVAGENPGDITDGSVGTVTGNNAEPDSSGNIAIHSGADIPVNHVLSPLPDPPLTPPPGADSEPVRSGARTGTVTEFFLLRDPIRDLNDPNSGLTDADFDAGLPPAVVVVPPEVDPLTNAPPFFVDIDNVEVFAGEELVVIFDPDDPDGGLPGMFEENIPESSVFDDNFNGTKSLRWRPLQPDVGIHEFTVTAIDPLVKEYRSAQTVRIKVKLPADQSGIRNLPPGIDSIRSHTVRVNDPVVVYIKVTDPNGTIPVLDILNPPPGSTITPHPQEDQINILHFVPDTAGQLTINLQATDSVDSSMSVNRSIAIEVLPEAEFERPGARLRTLATQRDLLFGYAALQNYYERPDGAVYASIAGEEFNIVSTENSMKFDFVNPLPGKYRWAATDNLVQQAKVDRQLVHGHTLVWHRQLPSWVKRSLPANRETIMREFIDRVLVRYRDDIPLWDVVNESLEDDGTFRNSVWYQGMGASYIDIAFRQARQSAPNATLIYNDYDIAFAGPKANGMLALVQQLKDAGTPIDGVGFQLHVYADFDKIDEVIANFQKVADMDLDIYVTELDVSIGEGQTPAQQAEVYEKLLSVCLAQPRCKAFQTWGFTDMYSWRRGLRPLLLDERYQVKPAYLTLQQRLSEN